MCIRLAAHIRVHRTHRLIVRKGDIRRAHPAAGQHRSHHKYHRAVLDAGKDAVVRVLGFQRLFVREHAQHRHNHPGGDAQEDAHQRNVPGEFSHPRVQEHTGHAPRDGERKPRRPPAPLHVRHRDSPDAQQRQRVQNQQNAVHGAAHRDVEVHRRQQKQHLRRQENRQRFLEKLPICLDFLSCFCFHFSSSSTSKAPAGSVSSGRR